MYSTQSDKISRYLTVEVFKSKHTHLRTLASFPLYSCKTLMMLSKYQSLNPSQKKWKQLCKFNLQCYSKGLLSVNYPRTTKQGHKSRNSFHHTLWLLKKTKKKKPQHFDYQVILWTCVHLSSTFIPVIFSSNETSWTSWGREAIFCRTVASPDAAFSRSCRALIKSSVYKWANSKTR